MNNNGAFRKKRVYFSQVSNELLRDNTVSMKAKGLYAIIQSYITIENFVLYKNKLKKDCKEGEKAFEAAWKELKDKGYLVQYKLKDEKGNFYYEYDLLDISHIPKMEGVDHNPKKKGMDKAGVEKGGTRKGGQYNKTLPSNTNLNNTDGSKKEAAAATSSNNLDSFYNSIKSEMTEATFKTWIEPLEIKQEENKIQVVTASDFTKTMIKNKFIKLIEIHLKKYFEFDSVEVVCSEKLKEG